MKIQLMSDLHLEGHPSYAPQPAPEAEMLVLAGDIGSYQRGSRLQDSDFALARFSPRHGWPVPVLY
ncbi:MAG: metallophosphoesterase, partial [Burkholderiales bacterium]